MDDIAASRPRTCLSIDDPDLAGEALAVVSTLHRSVLHRASALVALGEVRHKLGFTACMGAGAARSC